MLVTLEQFTEMMTAKKVEWFEMSMEVTNPGINYSIQSENMFYRLGDIIEVKEPSSVKITLETKI